MKKGLLILFLAIITILIGLPWILWQLEAQKELDVTILNKTVPDNSYREHTGLMWLLNNQKYVKKDSLSSYDYKADYYGFFPEENNKYTIREIDTITDSTDLIYIVDTYGVYTEEYNGDNLLGNRSDLIYGGIQLDEIDKIRKAMYNGTTLIAEFNTFGSPTNEWSRKALYELLGIKWTGWIGRYFEDMSTGKEVPNWAVKNYETQYKEKWNFSGNGFLFVNEQDEVVVIEEKDIDEKGVIFHFTEEGKTFFEKKGSYRYDYWFDIIEPDQSSKILATYDLKLNKSGIEKLNSIDIPLSFPAVIKNKTDLYTSYYFSGDYADNANIPNFYKLSGLSKTMEYFPIIGEDAFYWKAYVPMMKKILHDIIINEKQSNDKLETKEVFMENGTHMVSRTKGSMLQVYQDGEWNDIFIKGVNMGTALPGKWFTEFPKEEGIYYRWFEMIGEMNSNTIRVYTLMDPSFYRALLRYNLQNKDNPLWLLQEIWPEENPDENNYLKEEYVNEYYVEIERVVDAIHGNASIPERKGRAYGDYYADISPYILGFLVGRELESEEVIETNSKNNANKYDGEYILIDSGSPTEVWLAMSLDHLMNYQEKKYGWQHPVAIVSWPTLDVMEHDSEWNLSGDKSLEFNDRISIDIRNLLLGEKMKAGLFGAYHIYPNYPDFMNNTSSYGDYKDEEGSLRYGGYLQHFIKNHESYPALVAEFGLANGMGNAHTNPDGYHHGSMTEEEQGKGIIRMMKAIQKEGYAGGVIFEWIDEWAKKTWTTESLMIPYEHKVFWHNAIDPEQNYGILAMESIKPEETQFTIKGSNIIRKIEMSGDETYLYLDIFTDGVVDLSNSKLLIGLDTYDPLKGSFVFNESIPIKSQTGMEFLVELKEKSGKLLVIPEYNIASYNFASVENSQGVFETINPIINKERIIKSGEIIEEIREDGSRLNYGEFAGSFNNWYQRESTIHLRLPWGRLNITDPTTYQVLDDNGKYNDYPGRDILKTATTDGIRITILLVDAENKVIDQLPNKLEEKIQPFLWPTWGEPRYHERLKESYYLLKEYFKQVE